MPHLTIEHSVSTSYPFDAEPFMEAAFTALAETGVFKPETIVVRSMPFVFSMTHQPEQPFLHFNLALYTGRSPEQLALVTKALQAVAHQQKEQGWKLSLRFDEMQRHQYLEWN
jgi:5-carboxymethyl-2-hydroxymuconate isomerase